MTLGLDTSVVVRLLIGQPAEQAEAARHLVDDQPRGTCAISDIVVGEAYFALRHHYLVPHARAVGALSALLADPRLRSTGVARHVLARMSGKESGAGLIDRLIHGGYEHDNIEIGRASCRERV